MMNTIKEIFAKDKITKFWPTKSQSHQENVFATIRFILYASVLIYILTKDYRAVYVGLAVIAYITLVGVEVVEGYDAAVPQAAGVPQTTDAAGVPQTTPDIPDFSQVHPTIDTTSLQQRFFKFPVNEIESLKQLNGPLGRSDTVPYFLGRGGVR
jgi:Family of unknown function (DUF5762)